MKVWKLKCERERQEQSVWKGMIEMIRLNFPRGGNSALITFGWSYHSCKPAFIVFFLNTSSPKTFLNIFLFNHFLPFSLFVIVLNNIFHRFTILWWIKGGHISYISVSQYKCTLFVCCTAAKQISNNTFNEKVTMRLWKFVIAVFAADFFGAYPFSTWMARILSAGYENL